MTSPNILVLMGVSGCGKTTVGELLADCLGWRFLEGDELHPPANIAKMKSGTPLDDADRRPWLEAIAARIDAWRAQEAQGVVACSALKRAYRDILIGDRDDVGLVFLSGTKELIASRLAARKGHFMPPGLLDSQFTTLQRPGPDERPITIDIDAPAPELVTRILAALAAR